MRCLTVAAAAALAALVGAQPTPPPRPQMTCSYAAPGITATYDLTSLSYGNGYKIINSLNNTDSPYDYYVSICNDMAPPSAGSCATTYGDDGTAHTGPAPAFQVCNNPSKCNTNCQRLGDKAANGNFSTRFNPAHGVTLYYTNGDNCSTPSGFRPRSMFLDFICTDIAGFLSGQDEVIEDVTCGYHAILYSRLGCPQQCPFVGTMTQHLCNGQGICDFDTSQNAARCFCDKGWSGPRCDVAGDKGLPPGPNYSGNIAGGFFGGLFAGAAVVSLFVLYKSFTTGASFTDAFKNLFGGGGGGGGGSVASGGYAPAPADASFGGAYPAAPTGGFAAPAVAPGGYVAPETNDGPLLA